MIKIFHQLRSYVKNDLKIAYLLSLWVFLAVALYFNYHYDFENVYLRPQKRTGIYAFLLIFFYGIPYMYAFVMYAYFYKHWSIFKQKKFWLPFLMGLFTIILNEKFYYHLDWIEAHIPYPYMSFVWKCMLNFVSAMIYFFPICLYWKLVDSKKMPLYGFGVKAFDVKPYALMLLFMLPLLYIASMGADFQANYPIYSDYGLCEAAHIPQWKTITIFEICYGLDFISVEFIFRGFMILALMEVVGIHAVLPMATLYCVFHFGKPAGEAISSFFGGAILGIVAYHSRSIYGGVLVHWGVAFLMELFAFWQK